MGVAERSAGILLLSPCPAEPKLMPVFARLMLFNLQALRHQGMLFWQKLWPPLRSRPIPLQIRCRPSRTGCWLLGTASGCRWLRFRFPFILRAVSRLWRRKGGSIFAKAFRNPLKGFDAAGPEFGVSIWKSKVWSVRGSRFRLPEETGPKRSPQLGPVRCEVSGEG